MSKDCDHIIGFLYMFPSYGEEVFQLKENSDQLEMWKKRKHYRAYDYCSKCGTKLEVSK